MKSTRERIVIDYDEEIDSIQWEYFGGLPKTECSWPEHAGIPGIHLLSLAPPKAHCGLSLFYHPIARSEKAYTLVRFSKKVLTLCPDGAVVLPKATLRREAFDEELDPFSVSFVATQPLMRHGQYPGKAFFAQLTNDILPYPSESATLYFDQDASLFWQI